MLKNYEVGGDFYLADDSEESFLWELEAMRRSVSAMEAKAGKPTGVLTDTRKKIAFLETFVETDCVGANDSTRMKPEFRSHAGQLLAEAQHNYPNAHVPIM